MESQKKYFACHYDLRRQHTANAENEWKVLSHEISTNLRTFDESSAPICKVITATKMERWDNNDKWH